ncbi:hypothetical protein ALC56_14545, partial [Trachymyrmex septentrionalis]
NGIKWNFESYSSLKLAFIKLVLYILYLLTKKIWKLELKYLHIYSIYKINNNMDIYINCCLFVADNLGRHETRILLQYIVKFFTLQDHDYIGAFDFDVSEFTKQRKKRSIISPGNLFQSPTELYFYIHQCPMQTSNAIILKDVCIESCRRSRISFKVTLNRPKPTTSKFIEFASCRD